jgi:hypothetical protein
VALAVEGIKKLAGAEAGSAERLDQHRKFLIRKP